MATTEAPPRTGRRLPVWRMVAEPIVGAIAFLVVLVVTLPALAGLSDAPGFAHLTSFRLICGLGWFVVALMLAPFVRRRYPLVIWLLVVAVLAGAVNSLFVVARGTGDELTGKPRRAASLLTLNTLGGAASVPELTNLIVRTRADAVALPETSVEVAREIADRARARGHDLQVFGGQQSPYSFGQTSLLVSYTWGGYQAKDTPDTGLGAIVVEPRRGRGPVIAAVHSPPPMPVRVERRMWPWLLGADAAARLCRTGQADVVLGDVNMTPDHPSLGKLGRCRDAAGEVGAGAMGTWPARFPAAFGAPIDHVFLDSVRWRAMRASTVRVSGTDHRAVVVYAARNEKPYDS
ncbi:MAG: hypothetical protein GEV10_08135 [Streptosporangiales bacterium]|nr:hypothetical protein [Streptosporangiales bacterium]